MIANDEAAAQEPKPKPILPADWPTYPPAFGPGWMALPRPFSQVHESDFLAACRQCGGTQFTMFVFVKSIKDPNDGTVSYHQRSTHGCQQCIPPPSDAIAVGVLDMVNRRVELYGGSSGR